jgi:predicted nucleic acid-binding protein
MVKPLLDTNVLIDYLNGLPQARTELAHYDTMAISIISWMEVMAGVDAGNDAATRRFLSGFSVLDVDQQIAERAVAIRKARRLKLPDAIIGATAERHEMLLVTRNEKDFPDSLPGVRVPYRLP